MITTNAIEKVLLQRELDAIAAKLAVIGKQLVQVFEHYCDVYRGKGLDKGFEGDHSEALDEFIKASMFANSHYYGGTATAAGLHPVIPETLQAAILKKVSDDFVTRVAQIEEIATEAARATQ